MILSFFIISPFVILYKLDMGKLDARGYSSIKKGDDLIYFRPTLALTWRPSQTRCGGRPSKP